MPIVATRRKTLVVIVFIVLWDYALRITALKGFLAAGECG
jgi:hypothetical protein